MFELESKYGKVVVYAETIEQEAIRQIIQMANSPVGENAHIRIMPDAHAGAGCTIGTTMIVADKVCPNTVGVDIGCGVDLARTNIDFQANLESLDAAIRKRVPSGMTVHQNRVVSEKMFSSMYCWPFLKKETRELASHSLGTLGGGNHFIEAYDGGELSVHSGSRNIGYNVAKYYQKRAEEEFRNRRSTNMKEVLQTIPPQGRQEYVEAHKPHNLPSDLLYVSESNLEHYLHDCEIMQKFAVENRKTILQAIINEMGGNILGSVTSQHNYVDARSGILRKGAISAQKGEMLVIPLNMRDGLLVCRGKGNPEWNYSAPHGAGRLYSRSKAKELFTVKEYSGSMSGIYTTCVNQSTLDEAPFVYKDCQEIEGAIQPTVEIEKRLIPIFNFKAD